MKSNRRFFLLATGSFMASMVLASCTAQRTATSSQAGSQTSTQADFSQPLRVSVTPVPAGEILAFVRDKVAPAAGLKLEIKEFNDFNQPNLALKDGAVDAAYYQHIPFMQTFGKQHNMDMVALNAVHFNPLGAFSKRIKSLDQLQTGATVTIPNDPTNGNRALRLLAANGLIKLRDGAGELATVSDIAENPKQLKITEIEAPSLLRSLDDVDVAVITGNFIVQAGMNTKRDAIAIEQAGDEAKYAVRLVTMRGKENDPRIQKLNELLHDPQVRDFINQKYQGAVVPVF